MSFILSPEVMREATSFLPFKMPPNAETHEVEEDVYFIGATQKPIGDQTVVEVTLKVMEHSSQHPGVQFRTDVWLDNAICAGTIRAADADERTWKNTKSALRTLANLQKVLGLVGDNPVDVLTNGATGGTAAVKIRIYRANSGQFKWSLDRVKKAGA